MPSILRTKFKTTDQEFLVAKDKKLIFCPTPNCGEVIQKPCCCKKRAVCTECTNAVCFKCGNRWHKGTKCMTFEKFAVGHSERFWPCPNCSAAIEKLSGCNHMSCELCRTHFCWICKQKISQTDPGSHFKEPPTREEQSSLYWFFQIYDMIVPPTGFCSQFSETDNRKILGYQLALLPFMPFLVFLATIRGVMTIPRLELTETFEELGDKQPFVYPTVLFMIGLICIFVLMPLSLVVTALLYVLYVVMILWSCVKLIREFCC